MSETPNVELSFVVCVQKTTYEASLELHKIYRTLPDEDARDHGYVRVVDESGEDYLYPEAFFVSIEPSEQLKAALLQAA